MRIRIIATLGSNLGIWALLKILQVLNLQVGPRSGIIFRKNRPTIWISLFVPDTFQLEWGGDQSPDDIDDDDNDCDH